ncbi:metal-sensitive transcriptional regulator [Bacillus horti]|uniref:DNA-binding FrmR family transcriptional regulator n=1 Tax=Caldalkalibacillus horti TaxID=77523 RepID=A0ABT9VZ47_9BACI|nr:metal-sensitive transcriptional regulator [Bacillus horti]MDQ0166266.1 DNA-binding FrmR family transcriptional regulator [Bacillus horti]
MEQNEQTQLGGICCREGHEDVAHISEPLKENLTRRLNRIEGQVRGIKGMIDRNVYCDDILNQMSAVQSALHSVSKLLLESHMKSCVMGRLKDGDAEVIDEFTKTISKLLK